MAKTSDPLYEQYQRDKEAFEAYRKAQQDQTDRALRTKRVASLADVAPVTLYLEIERVDGEILAIPTRNVGYTRLLKVQQAIPLPTPPPDGFDATNKKPTYNYNDPGYLDARQDAFTRRDYAALLEWVDLVIPGDTLEARVEAFERVFTSAETRQMFEGLNLYQKKGGAQLQSAADHFLGAGHGDPPDLRAAREAGAVVLAAVGAGEGAPAGV